MAQGTFDLIHPGHIHYLKESSKLGDHLTVVIARDSRVDKDTYFDENERKEILESLETVDKTVLGSEGDIYATVGDIDPDVITLGYDQNHDEKEVKELAEKATGHKVEVKRISNYKDYSSSDIRSFNR